MTAPGPDVSDAHELELEKTDKMLHEEDKPEVCNTDEAAALGSFEVKPILASSMEGPSTPAHTTGSPLPRTPEEFDEWGCSIPPQVNLEDLRGLFPNPLELQIAVKALVENGSALTGQEEPRAAAEKTKTATPQELAATPTKNQQTLLPCTSLTSAAIPTAAAKAEEKEENQELHQQNDSSTVRMTICGQDFTPSDFLKVSTSRETFSDIVFVGARSLAYCWKDQLDAMIRPDGSSLKHGLGVYSNSSPWPAENMSWLCMGYDRRAKGWSDNQCFQSALNSGQIQSAERLLDAVRKIVADVKTEVETSPLSTFMDELRFNVVTMVEQFLQKCQEGVMLHGPLLGYV